MTKLFLVHTNTGKRFEVVKVDQETKTVTLRGEYSTFDERYDPALFKQRGYKLERVNDE